VAEPAPAKSTLANELELLEAARGALAQRAYEEALRLAAQHRASFPDGVLAPEREAIEVRARCSLKLDAPCP
jgi:hypothetical protein